MQNDGLQCPFSNQKLLFLYRSLLQKTALLHCTESKVVEEAKDGKIYVRGHDRDGRPIIFYTPGLEQSFNVREVQELMTFMNPNPV